MLTEWKQKTVHMRTIKVKEATKEEVKEVELVKDEAKSLAITMARQDIF